MSREILFQVDILDGLCVLIACLPPGVPDLLQTGTHDGVVVELVAGLALLWGAGLTAGVDTGLRGG